MCVCVMTDECGALRDEEKRVFVGVRGFPQAGEKCVKESSDVHL